MAKPPTTKFPIRYIHGLPREAQEDIYRDLQALSEAIDNSRHITYDVIVDPTISTNDTAARRFNTVFAAVAYAADTLLLTNITVGVVNTDTPITETASYAGTASDLTVRVVGVGSAFTQGDGNLDFDTLPVWDWQSFNEASKWDYLIIGAIYMKRASGNWFANDQLHLYATGSVLDGHSAATSSATCDLRYATASNSAFIDTGFKGTSTLRGCHVEFDTVTSASWTGNIVWHDVSIAGSASITMSSTLWVVIDGTASDSPIFTVTQAEVVAVNMASPALGGFGGLGSDPHGLSLLISSNRLYATTISGQLYELTVPGRLVQGAAHSIRCAITRRADITGPANINLALGFGANAATYGLRLRGVGIVGSVSLFYTDSTSGSATLLDMLTMSRSVLTVSLNRSGGTGASVKGYNFDAGCSHNLLVMESDTFSVASADAGSNDLVITDAGVAPTGAAGGALAGSYPNPSLAAVVTAATKGTASKVPQITYNAAGQITGVTEVSISGAGIDSSAIHSGDAAGGDLTGTYANPTLAAVVTAATKGTASKVPQITYDAKGRITAVTEVSISGAGIDSTAVHSGDAAGGDLTGTFPSPTLGSVIVAGGPTGDATHVARITWDAKGRLTAVSSVAISGAGIDTSAIHSGDAAGGDLAGTLPNPTLAATAVAAGTYGAPSFDARFTVDSKGRLTAASNVRDYSADFMFGGY